MWQALDRPLALLVIVMLPLAWGLGVEYLFELWRRKKRRRLDGDTDIE